MKKFLIIVEGEGDKKFFQDYFHHLFQQKAPENSMMLSGIDDKAGGYHKLETQTTLQAMRQNSDNGGVNLVIFDADEDIEARRKKIEDIRQQNNVEFELFLMPNNNDVGALEDMLEKIIHPDNQPVMDCWQTYEDELKKVKIPTKNPPELTIPAKKTKIYAYLETLLGKSKSQKKLIKDANRNYRNSAHWDLDHEYLNPLKTFLIRYLAEENATTSTLKE